MTPNSYIKIHDRFKQFCIDTFGENDYKTIYELYSKVLLFKFQSSYDSNGKLIKSSFKNNRDGLFQSRVQNISSLIKLDGIGAIDKHLKDKFIAAAIYTYDQYKIGNLPDKFKHISSFTNFVKNFKMNSSITSEEKVVVCKPKKYKKVREDFEDEFYNWDYKCSECGKIIDAWTNDCECGAIVDWRNRTE
jgi:hypothetical protein